MAAIRRARARRRLLRLDSDLRPRVRDQGRDGAAGRRRFAGLGLEICEVFGGGLCDRARIWSPLMRVHVPERLRASQLRNLAGGVGECGSGVMLVPAMISFGRAALLVGLRPVLEPFSVRRME